MLQWLHRMDRGVSTDVIIEEISECLSTAHGVYRNQLASHLETFLVIAKREQEALTRLDRMIEKCPDDIRLWIRKANINLFFVKDTDEALRCIDTALELGYKTLFFRREALGVKARILLKLGRGEELSKVLDQIMSVKIIKGVADIGCERDFVDRAPVGLIPEDVLARYDRFCPKRSTDTDGDEPPP